MRAGRVTPEYFQASTRSGPTGLTDADILDIKAYLFTRTPVARPNEPPGVVPPFGWRFMVPVWKAVYFTPGPLPPDPAKSAQWNRGAYVVKALGHCGECHTPRDILGGPKVSMTLAGTGKGPDGGIVPNITPDEETGIGKWSDADLEDLFKLGMLPDADFVGDVMGEVVDETTSKLTSAALKAVILYLRSVNPVRHRVEPKKKSNSSAARGR